MDDRPPWWRGARGEWWVVGQTILLAALIFAPTAWRWTAASRALWIVPGVLLVAAGLAFAGKALLDLGPSLSPLPRPRRRAVLVQTGTYAYARHPIYGGLIVAGAGWTLWRTSGLHLLLAAALGVYLDAKARHEETLLTERFPDYAAYRSRVTKRLIPWIF